MTVSAMSRTGQAAKPSTLARTGRGIHLVGLLEDGRGLAATRLRVDDPGHRYAEVPMQTWHLAGREVTNRAGAGEYLGLAHNTAAVYFSPSGRQREGVPDPLGEQVDGQDVWALDQLAAWQEARRRRRGQPAPTDSDPAKLIGVREFAELLGVSPETVRRYVKDSLAAWERGENGLLPLPDVPRPVGGVSRGAPYRWRRDRAVAVAAQPARVSTGRPTGAVVRVADLQAVLEAPTVRELAAALSVRLGTPVSPRAVQSLQRRAAEGDAEAARAGGSTGAVVRVADLQAVLEAPTVRELAAALSVRLGTPVSSQTVRRIRRRARNEAPAAVTGP